MDDYKKQWDSVRQEFDLDLETAHVWNIPLDVAEGDLDELEETLAPEERQRAESFRFDIDRTRFIAGRGTLRNILGRYLGEEPARIEIGYEPYGKPVLAGQFAGGGLQFNLAHSSDLAVLAVTRWRLVGIDLERVGDLDDVEQLVETICSLRQIAEFQTLPRDQRNAAFFRLWTRKEAWLKATGNGIATALDQVEPGFRADEPPRYEHLPAELASPVTEWTLYELVTSPGFVAALALDRPVQQLMRRSWIEESASNFAYA